MKFPYLIEALKHAFMRPSTEKFPKALKEAPPGYRGKLVFHADRCINCGLCMRVCSPGAIHRTVEKTAEGDLVTLQFEMDSCSFCQMCSDFCGKNAIELSPDYMMVVQNQEDLTVKGTFLKKPPAKKTIPAAEAKPEQTAE